ncbi:cilia- and flagella-associated protein 61 isoform X2 [Aquarana catesbeiana]|uniref:cilia- and flagella-associated protein 61 isoform X2 n=1 Tax=Aquarana catesbeiana TaxID=8400 RepID=UPI003CC99BC6
MGDVRFCSYSNQSVLSIGPGTGLPCLFICSPGKEAQPSPVIMTILTSASGTTQEVTVRRTESLDVHGISELKTSSTQSLFGNVNVIYLLEKSSLAVTISDDQNSVIAHAAFLDYPSWDVVDQSEWEEWIHKHYEQSSECTPLNTLFLHLFVTKEEFSQQSIQEILRSAFNAVADLHFICLVVPSNVTLSSELAATFEPMKKIVEMRLTEEYTVYICPRHKYSPQLFIRKAREEDYDDMMPIFMHHNDTLKATYGEYFLAELIKAQDEQNHAVVCEDHGTAVGFMSVSYEVNVQLLQDSFDLGPFHGLCKPHPEDVLKEKEETALEKEDVIISRQASQRSGSKLSQLSDIISVHETDEKVDLNQDEIITSANENTTSEITEAQTDLDQSLPHSRASTTDDAIRGVNCKTPETPRTEAQSQPFRPIYRGDVSAFCIQLFCIDEKHETRSIDFLSHVFSLFPDKDFCIITVPHLTPEFPLLQSFVRAIPLSTCTLPQELYIFHRAGLINFLQVRAAKSSDVPAIEKLIGTMHLHESILKDLEIYNDARRDADGTPVQAFVAEVAGQIVGISVLRNEEDIEYIRSHYNIEDFIYYNHHQRDEHGHLHHYALNPIFKHFSKYFLKEILRLSHKSSLYYPIYPPCDKSQFKNPCAHSLTSALHYMVPVRPRRQIVYPLEKLGINAPSKQVSKDQPGYALYHFNRKLTFEPKMTVNARIVVVGASDVGISFLETLVFCPHLKFNNITLVSTHGLPGNNLSATCMNTAFLSSSHCYNDKDYALMSLRSWVNVVVGKMTGIDRAAKFVIVSNDRKVPYDHLILCTGQQYQIPCPSGADINKLLTNHESPDCSKQRYTGKIPSNLFTPQDEEDCFKALNWLKDNVLKQDGNVIVYGNTLDAYTTVGTLLSIGISGIRIHLVQPPLTSNITCFNNYTIEETVQKALMAAGVTTYYNCKLAQWNDGADPDPIHCASFTTDTKPLRLQCSVVFSFFQKGVDHQAFIAINDACLVYDRRLVIDTTFHTNDISIRAAGPLTKYSNRYYANEWSHSYFSSKEIGCQLAACMLPLFDPTLEPMSEPPQEQDKLITIYKGPVIQGGIVPGGYHYLHVSKPALPCPLQAQMLQPNYGQEIVTGKAANGDYFRLHINQYNMVETITCLSLKPFPASNIICLYGQHERLLNNLCSRFQEGLIKDLYSYFMEAWCMAIYHDRFIDFQQEVREILASKKVHDQLSMKQLAQKATEDELNLAETPQKYLKRVLQQNGYQKDIEKKVLNYLNYNSNHLSMFAMPGIV